MTDNLAVVAASLADRKAPITHELLQSWHRDLMGHSQVAISTAGGAGRAPQWWTAGQITEAISAW